MSERGRAGGNAVFSSMMSSKMLDPVLVGRKRVRSSRRGHHSARREEEMLCLARRAGARVAVGARRRQMIPPFASSRREYCDGGEASDEEGKREVLVFLEALGIDEKYHEKIPDMATLLHRTKTEELKKEGMTIKERKKLLSHVEKYKRGLWAPDAMR